MKLESFQKQLYADLRDSEFAVAYLQDAWQESQSEFLVSLGDYVKANIGMAECARRAGLAREALYRMLSADGNPELATLRSIISACDLSLSVIAQKNETQELAAA